jgi:uncharacterized membrane protein HdeD (DUF308 family)
VSVDKLQKWWLMRGIALLALGFFALAAPFVASEWAVALLGLLLTTAGLLNLLQAWVLADRPSGWPTYAAGVIMTLAGLLVFFQPLLVLSGLFALVSIALFADGATTLVSAIRTEPGLARWWFAFGGLVNVVLAVVVWTYRGSFGVLALGVVVGLYLLSHAWFTLVAPPEGAEVESLGETTNAHPDTALGLAPHPEFGRLRAQAVAAEKAQQSRDFYWILTIVLVFFAIHVGRMDASFTWLGLISPVVAVVGDLLVALLLAAILVVPNRLLWRKLTRPAEGIAWRHRLAANFGRVSLVDRLIHKWLDARLSFAVQLRLARSSLLAALRLALAAGLPLTAVLVATNPIWGFSWYFNSENWASGVWEKITETRVDDWRAAMAQAVRQAYLSKATDPTALFDLRPEGVNGSEDFSFLIIGDPGEGDSSQQSLRDRYLEIGHRSDVKFLVILSDVIYPSGEMKDYEFNFYLPFKGFDKPIYAIPGNHDWYNALNGFLANFLEPVAARAAIGARVMLDFSHGITAEEQTSYLIRAAARLRQEYRVRTGEQRAPFFAVRAGDFTLLAVDTGILRRVDPVQRAWFEKALERARGTFTMVLLGHPLYAGGAYQGADDAFGEIHHRLRAHEVPLVMAGDTHDFEYYREEYQGKSGDRVMHHFVNGGGGAYLSIGTALDWPKQPPVADWAFYPRTDALRDHLETGTPWWKWPVWWWVKRLNGWPASVEALSAIFDFNHAPFFQSFMEVRIDRSRRQVRLILQGVNGPLHWRDLQMGGHVLGAGYGPDDPVEFVIQNEPRSVDQRR